MGDAIALTTRYLRDQETSVFIYIHVYSGFSFFTLLQRTLSLFIVKKYRSSEPFALALFYHIRVFHVLGFTCSENSFKLFIGHYELIVKVFIMLLQNDTRVIRVFLFYQSRWGDYMVSLCFSKWSSSSSLYYVFWSWAATGHDSIIGRTSWRSGRSCLSIRFSLSILSLCILLYRLFALPPFIHFLAIPSFQAFPDTERYSRDLCDTLLPSSAYTLCPR